MEKQTFWKEITEVYCRGCGVFVDLSEFDTARKSIEKWNSHIDKCSSSPQRAKEVL